MSVNRLAKGYQPDWDIDAAAGRQGEMFVLNIAEALRDGTGEVKAQEAASKYGNVFIEFECYSREFSAYIPSGIETTHAETWTFTLGVPPVVAVSFETRLLRELYERALKEGDRVRAGGAGGSHPTKGVIVSLRELLPGLLEAHRRLWEPA